MDLQSAREKLITLQEEMSAYDHALSLLSYDGETTAPKGTADNRAHSMGILTEAVYKLSTGKETVELLEYLDTQKEQLTKKEQRMLELLLKDIRFMQKIPMDEFVAYEKLVVESQNVWSKAKQESDFSSFAPYLEKIFDSRIRFAHYVKPEMDAYDFWLNEYEPGLTAKKAEAFFDQLKERLVPLIRRCAEKPQVSDACIKGDFDADRQEKFARHLMQVMGLNLDRVGLSTTEHPFTTSLGSHLDERITTHYYPEDLSFSMFSVIHEGGHALYDTGSDEDLAYTVLDGGVSMGIHESQSRFYENLLGRSKPFCRFLFPKIQELFPEEMKPYTWQDFYRAVNRVSPSLIRTEADEVTYCLHVMIRFELEKKMMAGQMKVAELPEAWNKLYEEYLGIQVPDDRRGVLQDSHWSFGAIGYFPSYALGSAYGAQFLHKMKQSVDVDAALEKGDFASINAWNREHIWHFGSLLTPQQLLDQVLEEPFDPTYYLNYLEEKCKDVYGF